MGQLKNPEYFTFWKRDVRLAVVTFKVVLNDHGVAWVVWESSRNIPGNVVEIQKIL